MHVYVLIKSLYKHLFFFDPNWILSLYGVLLSMGWLTILFDPNWIKEE
jgi:hypothetical protein